MAMKRPPFEDYATPGEAYEQPHANPPQVGSIATTRFVRDEVPIFAGEGSIGSAVEKELLGSVERGEQVTSLTVNISPELWRAMGGRAVNED